VDLDPIAVEFYVMEPLGPDGRLGFQGRELGFDKARHLFRPRSAGRPGTLDSLSHQFLNATLGGAVKLRRCSTLPGMSLPIYYHFREAKLSEVSRPAHISIEVI
jgi:hypothetical protein